MPKVEVSLWLSKMCPECEPLMAAPGQMNPTLSTDVDSDLASRLNYALSHGMWDLAAFVMSLQTRRDTTAILHAVGDVGQQVQILGNQTVTLFQAVNSSLVNLQAEQKRLSDAQASMLDAEIKQTDRMDEQFASAAEQVHEALEDLQTLTRILRKSANKPRIQYVKITGATDMGVKILFEANWSPITDPQNDTATFELSVSVDGGEPVVNTFDRTVSKAEGLEAPADSTVLLSLVAIDASGNRSDADTFTFVASDVVPPPTPSGLGVTVTGQRVDPD